MYQRKAIATRRAVAFSIRFITMRLLAWLMHSACILLPVWYHSIGEHKSTFSPGLLVVMAQPHKNYRTCALHHNELLHLYYNSTLGMYIRYNNETDRSGVDIDDIEGRNLQELQRTRINNHNILLQYNNNHRHVNQHQNIIKDTPTQQQHKVGWYDYFMSRFRNIDNRNSAEPAIAILNHPLYGNSVVSPPLEAGKLQENRDLSITLTTSTSSNNNRGEGDRIRNIDPNIELYQPYEGRIVTVRTCHCSDRNINMGDVASNYSYYCPVNKNYCYVPNRYANTELSIYETYPYYYHPVCIPAPSAGTYFARNFKLIGCAALGLLIIILIVSPTGHHAIRCCCSTFIPGCFLYNQKYIDYMIQNDPKLAKYYLERYMKDKDREERFNQRYIELQRLHGEIVVDDSTIPDEHRNDSIATGTTSRAAEAKTVSLPPLNELEESIVHDMYYYRPSLILKTRTYKGSSSEQHQQEMVNMASSKASDSAIIGIVASSPYDVDILIKCSTESTKDMNLHADSGSTPCRNDDGCMICFNAIHVGSKVGVLPNCQHIFHTQCLKDWLKRRNVCPLCLDTDVATVAFSRKNDPATTIETPPPSIAAYDSASQTTIESGGR